MTSSPDTPALNVSLHGERPPISGQLVPQLAKPSIFSNAWVFWSLFLGLTAAGLFFRFWRLDFQAYWTDEAYTVNRIRGSYAFLLDQLSDQGFPPGWYTILRYWRVFGEVNLHMPAAETYQPGFLRLVPAFFGTLTVPAMYFLGRQFTDRKGALLVMLLAAVNPFLIYYSRDIKMYSGFWFFVVLNMALFFHWQSTRKHLLWFPLFLVSGVIMSSMHTMGWAMVALQFLFLLTRPRPRAWDAPLWVLAAGAAAIIPYYWYHEYMQPARWEGRISNDVDRGMLWIQDYTNMSWQTLAGLPTSHILGYLWPVYPPDDHTDNWFRIDNWFLLGGSDFTAHLATRTWAWMAHGQLYAALGIFAILLLGLFPWRGFRGFSWRGLPRSPEREASCTRGRWWWILLWIALPTAVFAFTWLPTVDDYKEERAPYQMEKSRATQDLNLQRGRLAALPEDSPDRLPIAADISDLEETIRQTDQQIAAIDAKIQTNWHDRIWHSLPGDIKNPKPLWEPRYLGIVLPAWLLWLGACLRRLPTWPLRTLLITATAAVCAFSSLSNHLIYRNTPFHREAAILEKFIDQNDRWSTAVAVPEVKYPDPAENTATTIARHVVPFNTQGPRNTRDDYIPYTAYNRSGRQPWVFPPGLSDASEVVTWLRNEVVNNTEVKTLVLTDRYGDMTKPQDALSDDALKTLLGPRWQLVYSETYEWHYEWRFYIFHTWRTRVWKLTPP